MVFAKLNGSTTTTATEAPLFDIVGDRDYSCWLFLQNMQAGDTFVFKVYVKDDLDLDFMRLWKPDVFGGVQTEQAVFVGNIPASQYKITVQRTAGTDRVVDWMRIER